MTNFPGSPRLLKGAIVSIDNAAPLPAVIIFQYNPGKMTRKISTGNASEGTTEEVNRTSGAPQETIDLDIEIDATDQLENVEFTAVSMGIYPQLSALEMLLYPKSTGIIANSILMAAGILEVVPSEAPLTLFIWGIKRVVPVRIKQFTINEEAYDTKLNPILAKVTLSMKVLSYNDFKASDPGYHAFMAHQVIKETMAVIGSVNNIGATGQ
jgi:hypothetical protein